LKPIQTHLQTSALKIVTSEMATTLLSSIKSGWHEYGISFAHPSSNISIRNITGQTRNSAGLAFGSEMSGDMSDVRAEGIRIVNSVHGIRIQNQQVFEKKKNSESRQPQGVEDT
jgi:hypothetical protein